MITLPQQQPTGPAGTLPGAPNGGLPSLGNKQAVMNQMATMKPPMAPQMRSQAGPNVPPMMPQAPAPQPPQPPQPIDYDSLPKLHDVVLIRTKKTGCIVIDTIDPATFIVDPNSKRLTDSFCGYRVERTLSQLRQSGYKNVDELSDDIEGGDPSTTMEVSVRNQENDVDPWKGTEYGDISTRKIWITCLWIKLDVDGDGISEWRYVVRAGNRILENVPSTEPPIAFLTPFIEPHLLIGESLAEKAMPIQKLNTTILRSQIDNISLSVNSRLLVDPTKVVLDDLLDNRPGGIVRLTDTGTVANAVAPMPGPSGDMSSAASILAYIDQAKDDRTGISKYSQGVNADAINAAAATVENLTARADMQLKRIIRTFAETGVRDLFTIVQRLLSQYQDTAMTVKLRGAWVDVDPRAWKNQYSLTCNVGLGTGDKSKDVQAFTTLANMQKEALQANSPFANASGLYKSLEKLTAALGIPNADQYWTDPSKLPPQPPAQPPVDPQLQLIQTQMQAETQKLQLAHSLKMAEMQAQAQIDAQAEQRKQDTAAAQVKMQGILASHQAALLDARERDKAAADQAYALENMRLNAAINREKIIYAQNGTTPADEAASFKSIEQSLQNAQ